MSKFKHVIYVVYAFLVVSGCSEDETTPITHELLNISEFSSTIISLAKDRDYSLHNQGTDGVFQDPDYVTQFKGAIDKSLKLSYFYNN